MAEIGKIAAICLLGAILALLLQKEHPELAVLLTVAACGCAVFCVASRMETVVRQVNYMAQACGLSGQILQPLLKTIGIALVSHTGAEICRDANQNALASVLETAGAFSAIAVTVPLFEAVWQLLRGML